MENKHVPETTDRAIMDIIKGKHSMSFEFMAANVLVKRAQNIYAKEPSEENLHEGCKLLKKLLTQNFRLPSVQTDLAKIQTMGC